MFAELPVVVTVDKPNSIRQALAEGEYADGLEIAGECVRRDAPSNLTLVSDGARCFGRDRYRASRTSPESARRISRPRQNLL